MLHAPISVEFVYAQFSGFVVGTISEWQVKLAEEFAVLRGKRGYAKAWSYSGRCQRAQMEFHLS